MEGKWWSLSIRPPAAGEPALLSLEEDIARELGVKLGDEIIWDVQGALVATKVANLREVDWGRFETTFFAVFQPGVLETAPQMFVTLVRVDSGPARGRLQRSMAERYPNVTAIDLSQIQQALDGILDRGAVIVRFLADSASRTGAIVLIGAVSASGCSGCGKPSCSRRWARPAPRCSEF